MRRTRLASCAVIASQRRRGQPGLAARRTSSRKAKERNGKEVARELKQNMRRSKRTRAACEFKRTLRHLPHGDPAPWASQVEQRAARGTSAEERNRRSPGGVLMKASSEATDEDDRHADGGDWRCQNRGQEGGGLSWAPRGRGHRLQVSVAKICQIFACSPTLSE